MRLLALLTIVMTMAATAAQAQGYDGLLAPDDSAPAASSSNKRDEPAGYQGVMPGAVPVAPQAAAPAGKPATAGQPQQQQQQPSVARPVTVQPQPSIMLAPDMPNTPDPSVIKPIRNSQDIAELAKQYRLDPNADGIPDDMAARFRLPATQTELLKQPRPRINGLLPMENNVKLGIANTMATLNDPKMPPALRASRTQLAIQSLKTMQSGLKVKGNISDRTYQLMGMPATYIKEEREAVNNSLARVNAALSQLQQ